MTKEATWWKTFDYISGHTYILGEKFRSKQQAMAQAVADGMIVLPQSTVAVTDDQRKIAILENQLKEQEVFNGRRENF